MDLDSLDDDDAQQLAARIGPHLDPGSYGDRVILTKRQFIAAATGVAGAGALATWGVDDATAQAAGSVGTSSSPVDVFGYDLDVANQVTSDLPMNGNAIENAGSVSTEVIGNDYHFAQGFSGSSPDERLDNALAAASTGDQIYLENGSYNETRTVSQDVSLIGTSPATQRGTAVAAAWEVSSRAELSQISFGDNTVTLSGSRASLFNCAFAQVTITTDRCGVLNSMNVDATFQSGTAGGIADGLYGSSTVTDNGANAVGDVI